MARQQPLDRLLGTLRKAVDQSHSPKSKSKRKNPSCHNPTVNGQSTHGKPQLLESSKDDHDDSTSDRQLGNGKKVNLRAVLEESLAHFLNERKHAFATCEVWPRMEGREDGHFCHSHHSSPDTPLTPTTTQDRDTPNPSLNLPDEQVRELVWLLATPAGLASTESSPPPAELQDLSIACLLWLLERRTATSRAQPTDSEELRLVEQNSRDTGLNGDGDGVASDDRSDEETDWCDQLPPIAKGGTSELLSYMGMRSLDCAGELFSEHHGQPRQDGGATGGETRWGTLGMMLVLCEQTIAHNLTYYDKMEENLHASQKSACGDGDVQAPRQRTGRRSDKVGLTRYITHLVQWFGRSASDGTAVVAEGGAKVRATSHSSSKKEDRVEKGRESSPRARVRDNGETPPKEQTYLDLVQSIAAHEQVPMRIRSYALLIVFRIVSGCVQLGRCLGHCREKGDGLTHRCTIRDATSDVPTAVDEGEEREEQALKSFCIPLLEVIRRSECMRVVTTMLESANGVIANKSTNKKVSGGISIEHDSNGNKSREGNGNKSREGFSNLSVTNLSVTEICLLFLDAVLTLEARIRGKDVDLRIGPAEGHQQQFRQDLKVHEGSHSHIDQNLREVREAAGGIEPCKGTFDSSTIQRVSAALSAVWRNEGLMRTCAKCLDLSHPYALVSASGVVLPPKSAETAASSATLAAPLYDDQHSASRGRKRRLSLSPNSNPHLMTGTSVADVLLSMCRVPSYREVILGMDDVVEMARSVEEVLRRTTGEVDEQGYHVIGQLAEIMSFLVYQSHSSLAVTPAVVTASVQIVKTSLPALMLKIKSLEGDIPMSMYTALRGMMLLLRCCQRHVSALIQLGRSEVVTDSIFSCLDIDNAHLCHLALGSIANIVTSPLLCSNVTPEQEEVVASFVPLCNCAGAQHTASIHGCTASAVANGIIERISISRKKWESLSQMLSTKSQLERCVLMWRHTGGVDAFRASLEELDDKTVTAESGALQAAVVEGNPHALRILLEMGGDARMEGKEGEGLLALTTSVPRTRTCVEDLTECVDVLVEFGADVNACDHCGFTPLHAACMYGHPEVAATLISHGADVNLAVQGHGNETPLFFASVRHPTFPLSDELSVKLMWTLLSAGCELDTLSVQTAKLQNRLPLLLAAAQLTARELEVRLRVTDAEDEAVALKKQTKNQKKKQKKKDKKFEKQLAQGMEDLELSFNTSPHRSLPLPLPLPSPLPYESPSELALDAGLSELYGKSSMDEISTNGFEVLKILHNHPELYGNNGLLSDEWVAARMEDVMYPNVSDMRMEAMLDLMVAQMEKAGVDTSTLFVGGKDARTKEEKDDAANMLAEASEASTSSLFSLIGHYRKDLANTVKQMRVCLAEEFTVTCNASANRSLKGTSRDNRRSSKGSKKGGKKKSKQKQLVKQATLESTLSSLRSDLGMAGIAVETSYVLSMMRTDRDADGLSSKVKETLSVFVRTLLEQVVYFETTEYPCDANVDDMEFAPEICVEELLSEIVEPQSDEEWYDEDGPDTWDGDEDSNGRTGPIGKNLPALIKIENVEDNTLLLDVFFPLLAESGPHVDEFERWVDHVTARVERDLVSERRLCRMMIGICWLSAALSLPGSEIRGSNGEQYELAYEEGGGSSGGHLPLRLHSVDTGEAEDVTAARNQQQLSDTKPDGGTAVGAGGEHQKNPSCSNPSCRGSGDRGNLKRCAGCQRVSYCDQACQRAHWAHHKFDCGRG